MTKKEEILQGLNEAQEKVVTSIYGKYCVLATAGSGKTHSMIARMAYMIANGIPAKEILAFTFTRKAANEIKTRVKKIIGQEGKNIFISTYHGFCYKFLRQYAQYIGYTSAFSVYQDNDKRAIISRAVTELGITGIEIDDITQQISKWKEECLSPTALMIKINQLDHEQENILHVYQEYAKAMKECNALDYDDLIMYTIQLLENNHDILVDTNNKYKYIMADENQDSSARDIRLISLLAGDDSETWNLMIIGDIDQSIYGFRGSDIQNTMNFIRNKNFVVLNMGQNYRSTKVIVEASDKLIRKNNIRIAKEVFTENEQGNNILMYEYRDEKDEAYGVMRIVQHLVNHGFNYKDIAILYRLNRQSAPLEKMFNLHTIPYTVLNGTAFSKRQEVQDIMAYVRLIINPYDLEAFRRIVNVPERFVGQKSIEKIMAYFKDNHEDNVLKACSKVNLRMKKTKQGIQEFIAVIEQLQECAQDIYNNGDGEQTVANLIREIVVLIQYEDYLHDSCETDKEFEQRWENVNYLIDMAYEYEDIQDFIESLLGYDTEEEIENENKVTMTTMHSSKGLEWPIVIIIGCNEGTCPSRLDLLEGIASLEETRRLFYVAMTRAKQQLYITRPKNCFIRGENMCMRETRFIREFGSKYLTRR